MRTNEDYDCRYAPGHLQGAMSIGIIGHGDSVRMGFGPGMTMIMTSLAGEIGPASDLQANIARTLGIGTYRQDQGDND